MHSGLAVAGPGRFPRVVLRNYLLCACDAYRQLLQELSYSLTLVYDLPSLASTILFLLLA